MSTLDNAASTNQAAANLQSKPIDSPDQKKLKKAASDFESIMLASLWKSMKQSFGTPDSTESDPAHGTLDDWGIEIMSGAVGRAGGLGLGKLILKHLEPSLGSQPKEHSAPLANPLGKSADKVG
jgi:Rod binding domain-containing protein